MSELIYTWLNDEVQLSIKVSNFDQDFSNGYLLGELLSKYNQQLNFREFKNLDTRDAKIKNFNLLKPTFDTLKVKFDPCIVKELIGGKKEVTARLLYQLKMALEKVNNPADVIVNNKAGKYNTVIPLMKINPPIEQYAKMDAKFFDEILCAQNRPQKSINLDLYLQKFNNFKIEQDSLIKKQEIVAELRENSVKEQMRKIELNKLQRNMAFQEDWNERGLEQWKKNQEITKQRVDTDLAFKTKILNKDEKRKTSAKNIQVYETQRDIDQFEENMRKKGIGIQEEDENGNIIKKEHKNTASALATMKRIKEKSQVNEFLNKERDKRRRKMIVDQAKLQRNVEVKKREELILKKLEQQSKQEKEIEYEIWRAYQCKKIILDDRDLRYEKYKQKNEVNVINAKYKEEQLLKILRDEYQKDIESKLNRQREIEIRKKQESRREVFNECRNIIDILFELTDTFYSEQQQEDKEQLDEHFINDFYKLFINQEELINIKVFDQNNTQQSLERQQNAQTPSKQFLSNKELKDYIESTGDWLAQHKFENHELVDYLNLDDKYIPNLPINNNILGDIVIELLQQYHKEEIEKQSHKEDNYLDWMPIKLSIVGYAFSGKQTLASCIERKYGVKVLSVDQLVNELLRKWEKYNKQLRAVNIKSIKSSNERINTQSDKNNARAENTLNPNESRLGSPDSSIKLGSPTNNKRLGTGIEDQEEIIQLDESSKELAKQIEAYLYSGKDLPDECYVELVMREIHQIMPEITAEEFLKQFQLYQLPPSSELELRAKNLVMFQDFQIPQQKEDIFKRALVNKSHVYTSGVVILDFPSNYNQAKLLEAQLSKFIPDDEKQVSKYEEDIKKAFQIIKPTEQIAKKKEIVKPGLDAIIKVSISKEESLRRSLGRRFDPLSKSIYHFLDNPPPVDNAPLIERLEYIRVQGQSDLTIVDKNCDKDNCMADLQEWYSMFGYKYISKERQLSSHQQTQKRQTRQRQEEEDYYEENGGKNQQLSLEDEEQFQNEEEEQYQQQFQQNQPPRTPSANPSTKQQEVGSKQQEEIQLAWQEVNGIMKIDEVFYATDKIIDNILKIKESKYEALQNKLNAVEEQKRLDEEIARIKQENDSKLLFATKEEINEDVVAATASMKMDPQALLSLINLWQNTVDQYLTSTQNTLFLMNEQKQVILLVFHDIQKKFIELIRRPDSKFIYVRQYQEEYNKFLEQNFDMCSEDLTKEELHQRVEDLHDQLYDIIEAKRDEAVEERNQIIKSQWIEREMERFVLLVQKLLSIELSRSFSCQQLITDYYAIFQGNQIQEVPLYFQAEISQSQEGLPAIEENGQYPRLEKIVDAVLKLHNGEEEVEEKQGAKKGGKQPPKKEDKKQPKKGGKGVVEEVEEKKELTPIEKASKEALNMEKAIFRYRVQVIKDYAITKLKEMRAQTNMLFGKLQDWIEYSFKVENDSVNQMDVILREFIEQSQKIQQEVQLNYVDVIVSHQVLNFHTPPPIILPAKEIIYTDKFTISQLYMIIEELKSITNEIGLIESRSLLQLLTRKTNNKMSKRDLPERWRNNTIKDYQKLIGRLDPKESGYVNSKDICSFICLFGSQLPSHKEQDEYYQSLLSNSREQSYIQRKEFTFTDAWFDADESCRLELNTNLFERPKYLKELIFYIHKSTESVIKQFQDLDLMFFSEQDLLDIQSVVFSLSASAYLGKLSSGSITNYSELLFT